ncbi:error-prone DNA polymerase [Alteromonas gilva]|uniref:Error-prone DNA polymerase n=1 Tax=Alteromonas gilva TaxID=2987522 RepID=A0ABT5L444_9ALTE|nr:error-prone DNA polymerase [Alteromonas gilva]MDC8831820.1 error-prone DNA polymerase [Alteromonas gilva]
MFAELVCQSNFSFLTGASHPEELVNSAAFLGYKAIGITDECSVAGIVRAHAEISANNLPLKLIVGSLFRLEPGLQLCLLCPNKTAYAELCRIITNARRRCEKGHYELSEWDLKTVKFCLAIWLPEYGNNDDHWATWLGRYFTDRCWIGVSRLLDGQDTRRFDAAMKLSDHTDMPLVATNQVLFHASERQPVQHILHAIRVRESVDNLGHNATLNQERSLKPLTKLSRLYPAQWLTESINIAQRCTFSLTELQYQYPSELVPPGYTATSYLRHCVEQGIVKRFPNGLPASIRSIIEKELLLIKSQQYEYFFLTIYDIVQYAIQCGILYQGRGSAANSVVCYCLEITAVDPRQINVLFERFISKERNEPPDIDVDFEHERREEIIQYIYQKYGRERTALAASVITFRFKSAFREVGKALGFAETQLAYWLKQLNLRDTTLGWQSQLLQIGIDKTSFRIKQLIKLTEQIIGFPRHLSQHVGGFVISAGPLYELVPVENAAMAERSVIQWDKDDLEALGLLKVDVLALGMLTAIRKTFQIIKSRYQYDVSIPFISAHGDDKQVFDAICRADTVGVFQIESRAQMSMLPRLKPRSYYDLVVQIAIVRPGPIQGEMVHPYLLRRHGKEAETYPSEEVKAVLSRTKGVPIFQEQVIQLAMVAAGFTGGEADQLRRAMASWKRSGKLRQFRSKLIDGMTARGYQTTFAEQLFEQICGFGEYGFPESHSASFAVLAYTSAWLKYYYPVEFYTGLLNSWPMGFYSPSQLVRDATAHEVAVLPVDVNCSDTDHRVTSDGEIRLGLRQINGLSSAAMQSLKSNRPANGYSSISEVKQIGLNQKDLAALASANALRTLSHNRFNARWELSDSQMSLPLLRSLPGQAHIADSPTDQQNMLEDYASLNLSLENHPIAMMAKAQPMPHITFAHNLGHKVHKSPIKVIGCVVGRQAPGTAGGVTFMTLEDHTGNINVVVWQATSRAQKKAFICANILEVHGIIERSDEGVIHVIAGKLIDRSSYFQQLQLSSRDFH